jgi:polysaccharide export outer membrane protein
MVSGGPSEGGSYRSIDLIRNNKKIKTVDLYNTFIYGRSDFDERLRSGDIIFINPAKSLVTSAGAFNRNSTYELRPDEYLSKILELSNGVNKFADLNNIYLERILDGEIKSIKIQNVAQLDSINSKDGDTIFIRNYSFRTVSISGAILNPGNYLMNEGDDIFDVINKSGGFTKNAYPFGGIYENKTALEINTNSKDILYNAFLKDILSLSQMTSDNSSLQPIIALTERLKESNATGRIVVDFINDDNSLIRDGDTIFIPEIAEQVYIFGEVSSEGSAKYSENQDIQFYVNKKGGLNDDADKKNIFVLHPNGETQRLIYNRNIFANQRSETTLYPGSIIFIPRKFDNSLSNRLAAQAYVSILGNLGLSLASLSVLKD